MNSSVDGPQVDLEAVEKTRASAPAKNRTPVDQPRARHFTDCAIQSHSNKILLVT